MALCSQGACVSEPVDLFVWRNAIASKDGPRNPNARLVLLTLSLHMKSDGTGAWPSQTLLAQRSGLSRRAVQTHLENAAKEGWLDRRAGARNGQGWRLTEYEAVVPYSVYEALPERPWEADPTWRRGACGAPPSSRRGANGSANVAQIETDVAQIEHERGAKLLRANSSSLTLQETLPKTEGALARTPTVDKSTRRRTKKKTETTGPKSLSDVLALRGDSHQEVRQAEPVPRPAPAPMAPPAVTVSDYKRDNIIAMAATGEYSTERIAKLCGLPPEQVRQIIAEVAA